MERYAIFEGFMPELEKKVTTIQRKCNKFGCDFHFTKVGEEVREVPDCNQKDPVTGKPIMVPCKFIICEVDGTAIINGWQFVASVEHTEKGNIFSKALTDVEIPEKYRNSDTYCEHCNSKRIRKGTLIVTNRETGEFKQVGHNCLRDFTGGMSASWAAYMASLKDVFTEAEEKPIDSSSFGWHERYCKTEEVLLYAAETIRHFGYSKSCDTTNTKGLVSDFFKVDHGDTRYWKPEDINKVKEIMERVGFNPNSEATRKLVDDALLWLNNQEVSNDYIHNLKVVTSLEYTNYGKFGLLVSLFPTYNRELEAEAKRKAEAAKGAVSEFVGEIGDRVTVDVESIKCITSWESCYNGYSTTTTYVWKIVGKDGNIYTWKTSTYMNEELPPARLKGTVKEHKVYREVKQTELTRCKLERR